MPDENITPLATTDYSFTPGLSYFSTKTRVEFNGSYLKQNKTTCNHGAIVNISTFYEINKNFNTSSYPTLENCLLEQLVWLNILILIGINILDVALDLIEEELFNLVMDLVEIV